LDAIAYYAENFEASRSVVNVLDRYSASSNAILQEIFNDSNESKGLKSDMAYIHANFSFLSHSTTKLEETSKFLRGTIK
jgi:predicted oxidoreductase (fatty acid repression mutant protein)